MYIHVSHIWIGKVLSSQVHVLNWNFDTPLVSFWCHFPICFFLSIDMKAQLLYILVVKKEPQNKILSGVSVWRFLAFCYFCKGLYIDIWKQFQYVTQYNAILRKRIMHRFTRLDSSFYTNTHFYRLCRMMIRFAKMPICCIDPFSQ